MKDSLDRRQDFSFKHHLQKSVTFDIICETQISQIFPLLVATQLIDNQDIAQEIEVRLRTALGMDGEGPAAEATEEADTEGG